MIYVIIQHKNYLLAKKFVGSHMFSLIFINYIDFKRSLKYLKKNVSEMYFCG